MPADAVPGAMMPLRMFGEAIPPEINGEEELTPSGYSIFSVPPNSTTFVSSKIEGNFPLKS